MLKPVKVRTILFTEACPLSCRYCFLKDDAGFGTKPQISFDCIKATIADYDKQDNQELVDTRLLFTGGEPFLFWNEIKEIIEHYGNRFQYAFNTSGYLFTEEMLEFLSHYKVNFVLSVDGGEKLTNYLRPVNTNVYKVGYMRQLKKILPTLLYYFPQTPFRIIVNPRYVDLLYEQYLEAEQMGFKYFTFILDFECRPDSPKKGVIWTDEDTKVLQEQFDLIIQEILLGFHEGIKKPQVIEINKIVQFLLKQTPYDVNNLPCQVFVGRSNYTIQNPEDDSYCMSLYYPDMEDAKKALYDAYQERNHQCLKDPNCPAFEYCAQSCCPQYCLAKNNQFFDFDDLECATNKIMYQLGLKFLSIANECCPDSQLFKQYINQFDYPGKEEAVINGNLLSL